MRPDPRMRRCTCRVSRLQFRNFRVVKRRGAIGRRHLHPSTFYCVGISIMRMQHSRTPWPEVTIDHRRWLHSLAASNAAQLRVFSLRARLRFSGLSQLSKITGGTAITITLFGDFVIITWLPIMILAQDIFINMLLSSAPLPLNLATYVISLYNN